MCEHLKCIRGAAHLVKLGDKQSLKIKCQKLENTATQTTEFLAMGGTIDEIISVVQKTNETNMQFNAVDEHEATEFNEEAITNLFWGEC